MKLFSLLFLCCCGIFLCGCSHFDYAGQDFPERSTSQPVTVFESREEIPAEKFSIIGHGTLLLPEDLDRFDLNTMLIKEARKHGADSFCIVSKRLVNTGIFSDTEEDLAAEEPVVLDPVEIGTDGKRKKLEKFGGGEAKLMGSPNHRKKLRVQVIFLLNRTDLDREIKLRNR